MLRTFVSSERTEQGSSLIKLLFIIALVLMGISGSRRLGEGTEACRDNARKTNLRMINQSIKATSATIGSWLRLITQTLIQSFKRPESRVE